MGSSAGRALKAMRGAQALEPVIYGRFALPICVDGIEIRI